MTCDKRSDPQCLHVPGNTPRPCRPPRLALKQKHYVFLLFTQAAAGGSERIKRLPRKTSSRRDPTALSPGAHRLPFGVSHPGVPQVCLSHSWSLLQTTLPLPCAAPELVMANPKLVVIFFFPFNIFLTRSLYK